MKMLDLVLKKANFFNFGRGCLGSPWTSDYFLKSNIFCFTHATQSLVDGVITRHDN